ncbi:MAG: oligoendopeptidase F family protein [Alphaproteobacteria bacterium]|nr:oligoendopeptidase F family protein [Alphaproteobacteria bacterium]MBL0717693.1 oligoendopeptidase F family protein [Alphaproteobacteria bacterium]
MNKVKIIQKKSSDIWDLSSLYKEVESAYTDLAILQKADAFKEIESYKGKLHRGAKTVYAFLKLGEYFDRIFEKLSIYTGISLQSNVADIKMKTLQNELIAVEKEFSISTAFFDDEFYSLEDDYLDKIINDKILVDYKIVLTNLKRYKSHSLKESDALVVSKLSKSLQGYEDIYNELTTVGFKFSKIRVGRKKVEVNHTSIEALSKNKNRKVREKAHNSYFKLFEDNKNIIASIFARNCEIQIEMSSLTNYDGVLKRSLYHDDVSIKVYDNLIKSVRQKAIPIFNKLDILYRKKLKIKEYSPWDKGIFLQNKFDSPSYSYDSAVEIILEASKVLGDDYVKVLKEGLLNGWVDKYPRKNKSSGGFHTASYTSTPFIFINYQGYLSDVLTLAHEAGHAMHTYYSSKNNNFSNHQYTILEAEVVSKVSEKLVYDYLLEHRPKLKAYILESLIKSFGSSYIGTTMCADFEKDIFTGLEEDKTPSVEYFSGIWLKLFKKYHPSIKPSKYTELDWMSIPHFYEPFYCYKYSTGVISAWKLAEDIKTPSGLKKYKRLLSSGGSKFPLASLKTAGVDLTGESVHKSAIVQLKRYIKEFEKLI